MSSLSRPQRWSVCGRHVRRQQAQRQHGVVDLRPGRGPHQLLEEALGAVGRLRRQQRGLGSEHEEVALGLVDHVVAHHVGQVRDVPRDLGPHAGVRLLQVVLDVRAVLVETGKHGVSREQARVGALHVERQRGRDSPVGERKHVRRLVGLKLGGQVIHHVLDPGGERASGRARSRELVVEGVEVGERRRAVEPAGDPRDPPVLRGQVLLGHAGLDYPARRTIALHDVRVGGQEREHRALDRAGRAVLGVGIRVVLHHQVATEHVLVHVHQHVHAVLARELDHLPDVAQVILVVLAADVGLHRLPGQQQAHRVEAHVAQPRELLAGAAQREGPADVREAAPLVLERELGGPAGVHAVEEDVATEIVAQVRPVRVQVRDRCRIGWRCGHAAACGGDGDREGHRDHPAGAEQPSGPSARGFLVAHRREQRTVTGGCQ